MATEKIELTGKVIGRLTVIREVFGHKYAGKHRKWLCKCACGQEREMFQDRLAKGVAVSCGCAQSEIVTRTMTTHGLSKTPIHYVWQNMLARCKNKRLTAWKHYGGRGISVCSRWEVFENFLADMGALPFKDAELDRINNDGNYEPSNCRWATRKEQNSNTRQNVFIEVNGDCKTVAEWSRLSGIAYRTLNHRAHRGVMGSEFLSIPTSRGVA